MICKYRKIRDRDCDLDDYYDDEEDVYQCLACKIELTAPLLPMNFCPGCGIRFEGEHECRLPEQPAWHYKLHGPADYYEADDYYDPDPPLEQSSWIVESWPSGVLVPYVVTDVYPPSYTAANILRVILTMRASYRRAYPIRSANGLNQTISVCKGQRTIVFEGSAYERAMKEAYG